MNYDSKAEQQFHQRNPDLTLAQDEHYLCSFTDTDDYTFRAKPDFWCESTQTFIEFKDYQLNTSSTKTIAKEKLSKLVEFKGRELLIDKLKCDWNHSLHKQAIVQNDLFDNHGIRMLVVFSDKTKLSAQSINKMARLSLDWCFESDL